MIEKKRFDTKLLGVVADPGPSGEVEALIAVMGNVDHAGDVIQPGAFRASIARRGAAGIKVLNSHQNQDALDVVGKCLAIRELSRDELPAHLLEAHPELLGALWAKTQFALGTPEGLGVYLRLAGDLLGWSIGYHVVNHRYDRAGVRHLTAVDLLEYSPVVFPANELATTLNVKNARPGQADGLAALGAELAGLKRRWEDVQADRARRKLNLEAEIGLLRATLKMRKIEAQERVSLLDRMGF